MVSALLGRIQSRESMESESGEIQRGGKLAGPSIGHLAAAEEAGRVFADLADDGPAGRRAESRVVPTPSARRCAVRAPSRASGNQSQSR